MDQFGYSVSTDGNNLVIGARRDNKSCNSKGLLDPEDLNGTLLFLLSDNSKYINGQNIIVDDGWRL